MSGSYTSIGATSARCSDVLVIVDYENHHRPDLTWTGALTVQAYNRTGKGLGHLEKPIYTIWLLEQTAHAGILFLP